MNGLQLIDECSMAGVLIVVRGDTVSLEGDADLVAHYAQILRPFKALIIACANGLVQELIEDDGLSAEQAEALAMQSIPRFSPDEWLSMIAELDALIDCYCETLRLSAEAKQRIHEVRMRQSLALIPAALQWFRGEFDRMRSSEKSANGGVS